MSSDHSRPSAAQSSEPEVLDETEPVACPLCGRGAEDAHVVGTRARFDLPVRNVACACCGLVYVTPRPTARALEAYYRTQYRAHYHGVKIPAPDGRALGPGDEGFEEAWRSRHRAQARGALALGRPPAGGRVLEVGCGDGTTLGFMEELGGVQVFGVEPDVRQAARADERGVPCFAGSMEEYEPPGEGFDQVQMFHVLEHLQDPLGAVGRLASWLRPGGRLVIEVPNVTQPYGLLEANFFQNAHLVSLSPSTLAALLRRAGLVVTRLVDAGSVYAVGHLDPAVPRAELPLSFDRSMLDAPEQDGAWVAERLRSYAELERLRLEALARPVTFEGLERIVRVLGRPCFEPHLLQAVESLATHLLGQGALRAARAVLAAAARGPHRADVARGFASSAAALDRLIAPPAGLDVEPS
ncbi:MAG: class I SAM-dependent methyltransferase [Sandaracinaceae bacterium]